MIGSVDEHLEALYRLRRFGIKFGLTTITRLLKGLGKPHEHFSAIHIAGTNGKGSIAAYLSTILSRAGYKVGLYTSPHLVRFNERIRINGHPIPDDRLGPLLMAVQRVYMQGEPPTFFECATAMAFYHFALEQVDWAIIETGMGGRYDATNVLHPKVSVISNISMEHEAYLGNTVAKIAREKAGIIKKSAGVVTGVSQKSALKVIRNAAEEQGSLVYRLGREIRIRSSGNGFFSYAGPKQRWSGLKTDLLGDHQRSNAALALGAIERLLQDGTNVPDQAVYEGLEQTRWPGRLEICSKEPLVIMDGAHNPAAVKSLTAFLEKWQAYRRLILVVGILKDKELKPMLRELSRVADLMILTKPACERAADPQDLALLARLFNQKPIIINELPQALVRALDEAGPGDAVCITGSLYTVGDAKAYMQGLHAPC